MSDTPVTFRTAEEWNEEWLKIFTIKPVAECPDTFLNFIKAVQDNAANAERIKLVADRLKQ